MYTLNDKINSFEPYKPDTAKYDIKADANESFITLPASLRMKLARAAMDLDYNIYPDCLATETCRAFAAYHNIPEAYITAGNGSDELISVITSAFLKKGDTILTFKPDFSMYAFYGSIYENSCIALEKDENFKIDVDHAINFAKEHNVNMLIFSNPCNPTGQGMERADVEKIISSLEHTLVVVDEAYMEFYCESVLDLVGRYDNLIVLKTCSKAFGLAALRLGFAVAGEKLTNVLRNVKSPYNVNSVTQAFGKIVLENRKYIDNAINDMLASRNMLYKELKKLSEQFEDEIYVYPTNTNFILVRTDLAEKIHKRLCLEGISIRHIFKNHLRISASSADNNKKIISAIAKVIAEKEN